MDDRSIMEAARYNERMTEDHDRAVGQLHAAADQQGRMAERIRRLRAYIQILEMGVRGEYPRAEELLAEDRQRAGIRPGDLDPT